MAKTKTAEKKKAPEEKAPVTFGPATGHSKNCKTVADAAKEVTKVLDAIKPGERVNLELFTMDNGSVQVSHSKQSPQ